MKYNILPAIRKETDVDTYLNVSPTVTNKYSNVQDFYNEDNYYFKRRVEANFNNGERLPDYEDKDFSWKYVYNTLEAYKNNINIIINRSGPRKPLEQIWDALLNQNVGNLDKIDIENDDNVFDDVYAQTDSYSDNPNYIDLAIDQGGDPNLSYALSIAIIKNHIRIFNRLLEEQDINPNWVFKTHTPLDIAVMFNRTEMVERLLKDSRVRIDQDNDVMQTAVDLEEETC